MKSRSGFTLIELLVVISVMAIITSMVVITFVSQQQRTRDARRAADLVGLTDAFDRHYHDSGSFPLTCDVSNLSQLACMSAAITTVYSSFQPHTISPTATLTEIRAGLPQISSTFRSPRSDEANPPINPTIAGSIAATSYFVFSPDLLPNHATTLDGLVSFYTDMSNSTTFSCNFQLQPNSIGNAATKPHRYVVGFFSESDNSWRFFMSPQRADVNNLSWTSSVDPELCATSSTGDLKLLSSS